MPRMLVTFLLLLISGSPWPAFGAPIASLLQQEIAAAMPGETIPVIVTFAAETDLRPTQAQAKKMRRHTVPRMLRETAGSSQQEVQSLLRGQGKKFQELWIVNGLALDATPELIDQLAVRPEVAAIELDATIELPEVFPSQVSLVEWNIAAVRAHDLWSQGITGQGVTVAILDSGVDPNHPDLATKWRGGAGGWFDPYLNTTAPYDPDGHGTMVAGVIVGGTSGGSAIGVAPDAQWVAAKIFRDDGTASNSQILLSLQWVLDPDGNPLTDDAVADVVNNSWGFEQVPGVCDNTFRAAVENLKAAGIAVVFSAGNAGPHLSTAVSPANYAQSFAVGAVDSQLLVALFSSRGPSSCDNSFYPEVVAPGVGIRTTNAILSPASPPYIEVSGTSFSAPHISGVMALLLSAFPGVAPATLEDFLKQSATDLGTTGPENSYGFGLANALAAYNQMNGVPHLAIDDSVPPVDDLLLDFGHIAPGLSASRPVTLRNQGEGILRITGIGTVPAPFNLLADDCTGKALAVGNSCTIQLGFSPPELTVAPYRQSLQISSDDPGQPSVDLALSGHGNTLPPAPFLVAPAQGATGVQIPVILDWSQLPDADGDAIVHFSQVSIREDFSDSAPLQVPSAGRARPVLLAGAGGLLLGGLAAGWRRRRLAALALVAAGLALLVACNGGGGSDDPAPIPGEPFSETVTELSAGTVYYWKVISEDSRGGAVESTVRSFTTAP